jgi:hypothetical protein
VDPFKSGASRSTIGRELRRDNTRADGPTKKGGGLLYTHLRGARERLQRVLERLTKPKLAT